MINTDRISQFITEYEAIEEQLCDMASYYAAVYWAYHAAAYKIKSLRKDVNDDAVQTFFALSVDSVLNGKLDTSLTFTGIESDSVTFSYYEGSGCNGVLQIPVSFFTADLSESLTKMLSTYGKKLWDLLAERNKIVARREYERNHKDEIEREARRKQYLKLKEEFENE